MNIQINLIKKKGHLYDLIVRGHQIIELYHNDRDGRGELAFFIYDPKNNTVTEIEPEVRKADFVDIHVSYKPCREVYYAVCRDKGDSTIDIDIIAYDIEEKDSRIVCSLNESPALMSGKKKMRVFVLSKTQLLIQTEIEDTSGERSLMGNILFTQAIYDTETNQAVEIVEENLKNNGINAIVPLNETEIMIKTGFSFIEDSRFSGESEREALIESVFTTTTAKFISDIALRLSNIDMNLIISTYFDKYILKPEVKDDYIILNVVDLNERSSDCIFYNYVTGEKTIGKNNDIDLNDLRLAYVINNTPYVRRYVNRSCEFVNLKTAENDISFYDEDFVEVCGNLFITYRQHGRRHHMRVYKYPHMDILFEQRCSYITGIFFDNNYYIYTD